MLSTTVRVRRTSSNCACSRITRFFLSSIFTCCLPVIMSCQQARNSCPELRIFFLLASQSHGLISSCVYMCVYAYVWLRTIAIVDQSREDALRRRREREREHRARETPEQREARLQQRRLRDREWARERLATETAEEREARLARRRVQAKSRLAAESGETQLEHLRSYRERRIAAQSSDEREAYLFAAFFHTLPRLFAIFVVLTFKL